MINKKHNYSKKGSGTFAIKSEIGLSVKRRNPITEDHAAQDSADRNVHHTEMQRWQTDSRLPRAGAGSAVGALGSEAEVCEISKTVCGDGGITLAILNAT